MNPISIWLLLVSFALILHTAKSDEEEVRNALIKFYQKLSNSNSPPDPNMGWNSTSNPCQWKGIICDTKNIAVKKIILDGFNLSGIFDPITLCNLQFLANSLATISLNDNHLIGENLFEIVNCLQLTRFHIGGNRFSGNLPDSLSRLNNLKRLDISSNNFSGILPDLTRISGMIEFLAQNNQLTGPIPSFDFLNFGQFNVSYNNLSGHIPIGGDKFPVSSYIGNPELCGDPLPKPCPFVTLVKADHQNKSKGLSKNKSKGLSKNNLVMFSGYILVGFAILLFIVFNISKRSKKKEERVESSANKVASIDDSFNTKQVTKNPEVSADQSGIVSSSLVVLTSPEVNGLKFEDLLMAPAELLGRGKHGTVYKVVCEKGGMVLAVKRIREWAISSNDFKERMRRLDQVRHHNVLPAVAFYYSNQEKLLVYEYQQNGSLFSLLHGAQKTRAFDWSSRLNIAATITNALAFMHQELEPDQIPHGNLKSSNILLNNNMDPCITEYGLMTTTEDQPNFSPFKSDIYGLGVILLELLTGRQVQNNGLGLAQWVLSVVREEWTVEVFDKNLIREGASEERMVNLLQIAVKCVNRSPEASPSINQVAVMVNTITEEEERSMVSEPNT